MTGSTVQQQQCSIRPMTLVHSRPRADLAAEERLPPVVAKSASNRSVVLVRSEILRLERERCERAHDGGEGDDSSGDETIIETTTIQMAPPDVELLPRRPRTSSPQPSSPQSVGAVHTRPVSQPPPELPPPQPSAAATPQVTLTPHHQMIEFSPPPPPTLQARQAPPPAPAAAASPAPHFDQPRSTSAVAPSVPPPVLPAPSKTLLRPPEPAPAHQTTQSMPQMAHAERAP
eukprot:349534-Prymnesium_polylepis.2